MKFVAIPARFLSPDGAIRTNLTEEEQLELSKYGQQPLSEDDLAIIAADNAARQAARPDELKAYLAARRRELVDAGVDFAGVRILCDDRSIAYLTALRIAAQNDPSLKINWKSPTGWVELEAQHIISASDAAMQFVQRMFTKEMIIIGKINVGDVLTEAQIDTELSEDQ